MKAHRQVIIRELIEQQEVTSQEQLRTLLRERGIEVTQATLSRDIQQLGLVKQAADGAYRSAVANPVQAGVDRTAIVRRAVEEYLRGQDTVEQLVVLKTDPGQAQPLAVALDRGQLPGVVGTLAGDDTILVICRTAPDAASLADHLGRMRG